MVSFLAILNSGEQVPQPSAKVDWTSRTMCKQADSIHHSYCLANQGKSGISVCAPDVIYVVGW